ncbi:hypothetical protein [Streptomyces sp. NPDC101455]|uniref:hypothetical protein n=1 Tax=Streptomyces sp. NPDC101455 TaxID=3366142 RepID=UPI003827A0DE
MTPGLVPGQVYVGAAVLGLALISVIYGVLGVVIAVNLARSVRTRRRAKAVLAEAAQSVDEALADPQVLAGFARLDAAARRTEDS